MPNVICVFDANLPLSPCASSFSATIAYNNIAQGTNIQFVFPNTVTVGSFPATPFGDGQLYQTIIAINGTGVINIPLTLSNCNMHGTEASYASTNLQFDCSIVGSSMEVTLSGPSLSTFFPDNGGLLQLPVNPNPISLSASPPTQLFNTLGATGARTFTIGVAPDVTAFHWTYTPETDITPQALPNIVEGINMVTTLPFSNGQLTLTEEYVLEDCIGDAGTATVTLDCPADCPDIQSAVNVNAAYNSPVPTFSVSAPQVNPLGNLPDGCDQEYEFIFTFQINQPQTIEIQELSIPINEMIYPISEILLNGIYITNGISTPIPLNNSSSFDVVVKTGFSCAPFRSCSQTSNMLYELFESISLRYSRPCDSEPITVSIPLPSANQGQEFLGTLLGGAQVLDYSAAQNTVPVSYEFMATNLLQFGLSPGNACEIQYRLVLTATANMPNGQIQNVHLAMNNQDGPFSNYLVIPIDNVTPEIYQQIQFNLTFQDCPWDNIDPFSGPVTLRAEVQAFCAECEECYRTLRCIDQTIIAHCSGDCTAPIGTTSTPHIPKMERVTFGWSNPQSYSNDQAPLASLDASLPPIEIGQQLRTFYPYDIFELTAYGHADQTGQQIGFEIAYPHIDGISFELLEAIFTNANENPIPPFNPQGCFTVEIPTSTEVFGYDGLALEQFQIWYSPNCPAIPDLANFKLTARIRVLNNRPVGFIENEFRLQFISRNIGTQQEIENSCDSYGNRLTFLSPGYDFERYQMPVTQSSVTLNPASTSPNVDPNTQFIVENNPFQFKHEPVANKNVDVCRTSAGVLVSGFGAKGGNEPDFPYEYRPMIDWPNSANMQSLVMAEAHVNATDLYTAPTTINDPNQQRFLPPIDASNVQNNIQGVYFELEGDCVMDNVPVVSNDFKFLHHAYVRSEEFELDADLSLPSFFPNDPDFYETPFDQGEGYTANLNFNLNTLLVTPTGPFNGNVYSIPITINQPSMQAGPVDIENVLVYYYLTYANGAQLAADDDSFVGPIQSFINDQITLNTNINYNGYSYYFNTEIQGSINGLIPINLACTGQNYRLNIHIHHFCEEDGINEFMNSGTASCSGIERNITLTPLEPTTVNGTTTANIVNDPATGDCFLEWDVTFTIPNGRPEVLNPNFIFNTPNGLILLSNDINHRPTLTYTNNQNATQDVPLNNAIFGLEGLAPPFEQNLVATFSLSPSTAGFVFEAGGTLNYRLRFRYSQQLCNSIISGFTLLGRLEGLGRCSGSNPPLSLRSISCSLPSNPPSLCCVPVNVDVHVLNACPEEDGQVIIEGLNGIVLDDANIEVINAAGIVPDLPEFTGSSVSIELPQGPYAVMVTLPDGNQMAFNANILSGVISPVFNATPSLTVCGNSPFSATISDNNLLNSAPYTYSWVGPAPSSAVVCTLATYQTTTPIAGEYSVTITNSTTECSATYPFTLQVETPTVDLVLPNTMCTEQSFELVASPSGGTLTINGAVVTTNFIDPITIYGSALQLGTNTVAYSVLAESGCTYTHTQTFEVIEECLCLCPNPLDERIIVPADVATGEDLVTFFGTNSISNRCIQIVSDIDIANAIEFIKCDISFKAGVQLKILQTGNVQVGLSVLHGCDYMWRGIWNSGYLLSRLSTIRDAQNAVIMVQTPFNSNGPNPRTELSHSILSNNFIGVTNEWLNNGTIHNYKFIGNRFVGGALLSNFPGQFPFAAQQNGLAGIKLNQFDFGIDNSNHFSHLTNGVMVNRSRLLLVGTPFEDIGSFTGSSQIYSGTDYYFYNSPIFRHSAIIATGKSMVRVIGTSILQGTTEEFLNCENGIVANSSFVRINDATVGTESGPCRRFAVLIEKPQVDFPFFITSNRIRSLRTGISIQSSTSLDQSNSLIDNNNISIFNDPVPSIGNGIHLSNLASSQQVDVSSISFPLKISSNTINLMRDPSINFSWAEGIVASSSPNLIIQDNLVRRRFVSFGRGIDASKIDGSVLACNQLIGWDIPGEDENNVLLPNTINTGMRVWGCVDCDIIDNTTSDTRIGMQFIEANTGSIIKNNTMRNHGNATNRGIGLLIGTNTDPNNWGWNQNPGEVPVQLDDQVNAANQWNHTLNPAFMLGAKKPAWYGSDIRFFVNNNGNNTPTPFYPSHQPNAPVCFNDPFFFCFSGTENPIVANCQSGSTLQGYRLIDPDQLLSVIEKYLSNQFEFAEYEPEMHYAIEKALDELSISGKLDGIEDPNGLIAQFETLRNSSDSRKHRDIEWALNSYRMATTAKAALDEKYAQMDSLTMEIQDLKEQLSDSVQASDSLIWINISAKKNQLEQIQAAAAAIQDAQIEGKNARIDSLHAALSELSVATLMEDNLKTINSLLFKMLRIDNYVFNAAEQAQIDQIAAICPIIGGHAVFKARGLQYTYNDSAMYDDQQLCESQGIAYRMAAQEHADTAQAKAIEHFLVYPSPSKGQLNLSVISEQESDYHLRILNLTGQVVFEQKQVTAQHTINLNNYSIASGHYFVTFYQNATGKTFKGRIFYEK